MTTTPVTNSHIPAMQRYTTTTKTSITPKGKDIYNHHKHFHYLKRNTIIKTNKIHPPPSPHYRHPVHPIKTQNPSIPSLQNKTKIIYNNILEKRSQNHSVFGERKWKDKITNIDFNKTWINTYFPYNQTYAKDSLYKFLHYAIKRNNFILSVSRDKILHDHCKITEDNIHPFTTFNGIKKIWTYFQSTYKNLTK